MEQIELQAQSPQMAISSIINNNCQKLHLLIHILFIRERSYSIGKVIFLTKNSWVKKNSKVRVESKCSRLLWHTHLKELVMHHLQMMIWFMADLSYSISPAFLPPSKQCSPINIWHAYLPPAQMSDMFIACFLTTCLFDAYKQIYIKICTRPQFPKLKDQTRGSLITII